MGLLGKLFGTKARSAKDEVFSLNEAKAILRSATSDDLVMRGKRCFKTIQVAVAHQVVKPAAAIMLRGVSSEFEHEVVMFKMLDRSTAVAIWRANQEAMTFAEEGDTFLDPFIETLIASYMEFFTSPVTNITEYKYANQIGNLLRIFVQNLNDSSGTPFSIAKQMECYPLLEKALVTGIYQTHKALRCPKSKLITEESYFDYQPAIHDFLNPGS